jgi:hypothetical protein
VVVLDGGACGWVPIGACAGTIPAISCERPPKTSGASACASDRTTVSALEALPHRPAGTTSSRAAWIGGFAAEMNAAPTTSNHSAGVRPDPSSPISSMSAAPT